MDITLIGQAAGRSGNDVTLTYSSTAGNTLIISCLNQGATASVYDSAGNTWIADGTSATAGATSQRITSMFHCILAAPITTVTVTQGVVNNLNVVLSEWAGIGTLREVEVGLSASGSKTPPPPVTVSAVTGDLVIGSEAYYTGTGSDISTVDSSYTKLGTAGATNAQHVVVWGIAGASGSAAPNFTYSTYIYYGTVLAAFSPTSGMLTMF